MNPTLPASIMAYPNDLPAWQQVFALLEQDFRVSGQRHRGPNLNRDRQKAQRLARKTTRKHLK